MRIVQVIENFYPDSIGGTETYVFNVSKFFIEANHEVHIIAPSIKGDKEYVYEGIYVHRYLIDKIASKDEYKQSVAPKGLDDFICIIKKITPDVVHFNTFNRSINIYHLKSVKALGIKAFLTPHISGIFCANGSMIDFRGQQCDGIVSRHNCIKCYLRTNGYGAISSFIIQISSLFINKPKTLNSYLPASSFIKQNRIKEFECINKFADGVIALSPWIETALKANGLTNVVLVRQGISENSLFKGENTLKPSHKLHLIYVGRVYPIKNLETLYNAITAIAPEKIELTMACICDNDDYAQKIKSQFCALPNVKWYEKVPQYKLGEMIRKQDFLVLTSISEMSPLVILESFANGTPVIGTDIPPIQDNVTDGINGILFPVSDNKALSNIFAECISNKSLISTLRSNIKSPRTFNAVANELLHIYNYQQS